MTSAMNWLAAWACSAGGPGRNREEHSGGRSTLGTGTDRETDRQKSPEVTRLRKLLTSKTAFDTLLTDVAFTG